MRLASVNVLGEVGVLIISIFFTRVSETMHQSEC